MPHREKECLLPVDRSLRSVVVLRSWRWQNHECINCLRPVPTHVCFDFRTFVCTACAGVHREFGHRVAPVRRWKCTEQEYSDLLRGGNARAAAELLANWDEELFPRPDTGSGDVEAVRDFIRKAYVVKCWQRQPPPQKYRAGELAERELPAQTPRTFYMVQDCFAAAKVPVETSAAFFCTRHDASAKRAKQAAAWRSCMECQLKLRTSYCSVALCPGCSALLGACMICGEPGAAGCAASPTWTADFDADCLPEEAPAPTPDLLGCLPAEALAATTADLLGCLPEEAPTAAADHLARLPGEAPTAAADLLARLPGEAPAVAADHLGCLPEEAPTAAAAHLARLPGEAPAAAADPLARLPEEAPATTPDLLTRLPGEAAAAGAERLGRPPCEAPTAAADHLARLPGEAPTAAADPFARLPDPFALAAAAERLGRPPWEAPAVAADHLARLPGEAPAAAAADPFARLPDPFALAKAPDLLARLPGEAAAASAERLGRPPCEGPAAAAALERGPRPAEADVPLGARPRPTPPALLMGAPEAAGATAGQQERGAASAALRRRRIIAL